jgi:hypothetical protein
MKSPSTSSETSLHVYSGVSAACDWPEKAPKPRKTAMTKHSIQNLLLFIHTTPLQDFYSCIQDFYSRINVAILNLSPLGGVFGTQSK